MVLKCYLTFRVLLNKLFCFLYLFRVKLVRLIYDNKKNICVYLSKQKNQINNSLDDIEKSSTIEMMNFDHIFRRFILTQSFVRGWGNPLHLQEIFTYRQEKIGVRDECLKLVPPESVQENTVEMIKQETKGDRLYINGRFRSPLANFLPHLVRD